MIEKSELELLVSEYEEITTEKWKIEDDDSAEWLIEKTADELVEVNRLKFSIENKIKILQERLDRVKKEEEGIKQRRDSYLIEYFERVDDKQKKKTKTMEKYRLPSGEIIKKYQNPDYKRDETKLVNWLKNNKLTDYVEVIENPKWGELKKGTITKGNQVILEETGEIIEGVEAIQRPPKLEFKEV